MRTIKIVVAILITCGLIGYSYLTNRFGAGFSMYDKSYFMEPPRIELTTGVYLLKWRYGSWGFVFQPRCKVQGSELHCSLQATSSSGSQSGQYDSVEISDPLSITPIKSGSVYWLEPDGSKIKLEVPGA